MLLRMPAMTLQLRPKTRTVTQWTRRGNSTKQNKHGNRINDKPTLDSVTQQKQGKNDWLGEVTRKLRLTVINDLWLDTINQLSLATTRTNQHAAEELSTRTNSNNNPSKQNRTNSLTRTELGRKRTQTSTHSNTSSKRRNQTLVCGFF